MTLYMVEFVVADLDAARLWFTDRLNFVEERYDPAGRFALLRSGEVRLALKVGATPSVNVNLVFETTDLTRDVDHLHRQGVSVGAVTNVPGENYRRVSFASPWGWKITLFEWSPHDARQG
jgi:hypothetical protein